MAAYRTERVRIGRTTVDQFVLFAPPLDDDEQDDEPVSTDESGDGMHVSTPARKLPDAQDLIRMAALAGFDTDVDGPVDPIRDGPYVAGVLHAVSGMWDVYLLGLGTDETRNAFREGWADAHHGEPRAVMATVAHNCGQAAAITRALTPVHDDASDDGYSYLVPMTIASASAYVACWSLNLAAMIADPDSEPDDLIACADVMRRKLGALIDQVHMVDTMMNLHRQAKQ